MLVVRGSVFLTTENTEKHREEEKEEVDYPPLRLWSKYCDGLIGFQPEASYLPNGVPRDRTLSGKFATACLTSSLQNPLFLSVLLGALSGKKHCHRLKVGFQYR